MAGPLDDYILKKNCDDIARAEWLRLEREAKDAKPKTALYELLEKTVTKPKTEAPETEPENTDNARRHVLQTATEPRQDWEPGLLEALENESYKDR